MRPEPVVFRRLAFSPQLSVSLWLARAWGVEWGWGGRCWRAVRGFVCVLEGGGGGGGLVVVGGVGVSLGRGVDLVGRGCLRGLYVLPCWGSQCGAEMG